MSDEEILKEFDAIPEPVRAYIRKAYSFMGVMPRLQDLVRMFHAGCGGLVTGQLGRPLKCAECGKEMTAFVSSDEETCLPFFIPR